MTNLTLFLEGTTAEQFSEWLKEEFNFNGTPLDCKYVIQRLAKTMYFQRRKPPLDVDAPRPDEHGGIVMIKDARPPNKTRIVMSAQNRPMGKAFLDVSYSDESWVGELWQEIKAEMIKNDWVEAQVNQQPTPKDSGHWAHSPGKRREIVTEYRRVRDKQEVSNKNTWATSKFGISGKTLKKYEDEFPVEA